ncbi:hypothetical protein [Allomuricauda sp. d1]|uniref:hypothetical protein n=1 Tax=Allomuricauda sp. d1 TaxID=3136725 RepID=UPI0031D18CA4
MKRVFAVALFSVLMLFMGGCDLDDDQNFHFVALRILDAEVPESFELNQVYDITVTYQRHNGCVFFQGFDVQDVDLTTRNIVAIGSELVDTDTACTQAVEEVEAQFRFQVLYSEPYLFRFYAGEDEDGNATYLEYTVEVSDAPSGQ